MATKITMPDLGESVVEGTVTQWFKQIGDTVNAGEILLEIDTDKVTSEIESPSDGVLLQIIADVDAVVEVGEPIGWIGAVGESTETTARAKSTEVSQPTTNPKSSPPRKSSIQNRQSFLSPVVARMVAHHDLDVSQIVGTGKNGRVRKKDVLAFLENRSERMGIKPRTTEQSPDESGLGAASSLTHGATARSPETLSQGVREQNADVLALTPMRRAIAKRMMQSKQTIPHVTAMLEVDLQRITAHRKTNKEAFVSDGVKLTYMAYFAVAVAAALKKHRIVNSSWSDNGILLHRAVNIGIATDLGEKGLIVPVVHNASDLSLLGAARAIGELAQQARAGTLSAEKTRNATYTITNYGGNGSLAATPIIAPPQCAILGLGKIERRPVVRTFDGEEVIVIRPMCYITHTYDHRILDGGASARFLRDVIEMIEHWK